jgi:hypothetical protein
MTWAADPETALVAACCRPLTQPERIAAIAVVAKAPFDAERLLAVARAHRVEALVEQGLAAAAVALPAAAAEELSARAQAARVQMLRNAGEEVRLAQGFGDAAIDVVFLKGATLAMLAHGALTHKCSWDIDLLVAHGDIEHAATVLGGAGYVFDRPEEVDNDTAIAFAKALRETRWVHGERGTTVELHWALADNPALLTGVGMPSARQQVEVAAGCPVPTLATPELFAFLAVHGTSHGWSRLKWLADFAALIDREPARVADYYRHAQGINAGRSVATALLLCRDVLGVPITDTIAAEITADRRVAHIVSYSLRMIAKSPFVDGMPDASVGDWFARNRCLMTMGEGGGSAIAYVVEKLRERSTPRRLAMPEWLLIPDALFMWIPRAFARRWSGRHQD